MTTPRRNRSRFIRGPISVRDARARVQRDTPHARNIIGRRVNPSDPRSGVIVEFTVSR